MIFKPERAHPIMIFTGFFKQLRGFLLPMIFTIGIQAGTGDGFSESLSGLYIAFIFMFLSLSGGFLKWFFFRYDYDGDVLHIRSGIFVKKERFIKKERVQTVNYKANVIYRLIGLVTLQIETAGGYKEPEIDIEAIDRAKAILIRDALSQETKDKPDKSEEENKNKAAGKENVFRIGYDMLILAGMTSGGVGIIFSFIALFATQLNIFLPDEISQGIWGIFQNAGFQILALVVFGIFLVSWFISVAGFIISYGEFFIKKKGRDIVIKRGLLERKELSIKEHRIQGIRITENPLRQLLGYAAIEIEVAGGSSKEDGFKTVLNPLIKRSEIAGFIELILPGRKYSESIISLPSKSLRRYIFRSLILLLPLPVLFYFLPGNIVWAGMVVFPVSAFFGFLRYRDGGYFIDGENLILRYRFFSRTTVLLMRNKIQALETGTNIIQKLRGLTTLSATVITVRQSVSFAVKDLGKDQVIKIRKWYMDISG